MARTHGSCKKGERLRMAVPDGHRKTTTLVAGLRSTRMVAPLVTDGPINAEWFEAYVAQVLVPILKPRDVVILDNLSSHKRPAARAMIEAAATHAVSAALQPRLQSHKEGILEAQRAPAQSRSTHSHRPVGQNRETDRPRRASRGPKVLHIMRIRSSMKGKRSKPLRGEMRSNHLGFRSCDCERGAVIPSYRL